MKRYYNIIGYSVKEGFESIFKHGVMSSASVGMLAACLLIVGSFALVFFNINKVIEDIGNKNEIVAFIDESVGDNMVWRIKSNVERLSNIKEVSFVSKDEGLRQLSDELGEYKDLLSGLENDNPLRHSLHITMEDIKRAEATAAEVRTVSGIANVTVRSDVIKVFIRGRNVLAAIMLILTGLLCTVSIFIISNTVRLSAFTRRDEIAIMKMVGAKNSFIRGSFFVEGALLGLIGALAAFLLQWFVYKYLILPMGSSLAFLKFENFVAIWPPVLLGFVLFGIFMGFAGSFLSIRKYLRV